MAARWHYIKNIDGIAAAAIDDQQTPGANHAKKGVGHDAGTPCRHAIELFAATFDLIIVGQCCAINLRVGAFDGTPQGEFKQPSARIKGGFAPDDTHAAPCVASSNWRCKADFNAPICALASVLEKPASGAASAAASAATVRACRKAA